MSMNYSTTTARSAAMSARGVCAVLLATSALFAGCRGDRSDKPPRQFLPDMDDQPKWKAQSQSEFFADSRTMRRPVEGTVAFSRHAIDPGVASGSEWGQMYATERADFLEEDFPLYYGTDGQTSFIDFIPVDVTKELIERGEERFDIYCSICHGAAGEGRGMVGRRWAITVANFHDEKYKDVAQRTGKDGYLFDVIRNGKYATVDVVGGYPTHSGSQTMPAYQHAVDAHDAWAIVAYLRTLQAASDATLDDVPESKRAEVQRLLDEAARNRPAEQPTTAGEGGGE